MRITLIPCLYPGSFAATGGPCLRISRINCFVSLFLALKLSLLKGFCCCSLLSPLLFSPCPQHKHRERTGSGPPTNQPYEPLSPRFFPREKIHDWGHVSSCVCPSPYEVHGKYLRCAGGYGPLAESMALDCAINSLRSALIVLGVSRVSTSVNNRGHDERAWA